MRFRRSRNIWLLALGALALGAGALSAQVPNVLYYQFNEGTGTTTANLASPGGGTANPTFSATPTWNTPGQLGAAHKSGAAILPSGYATSNLGVGAWTIEFWMKGTSGTFGYLCGDGAAGSWRMFAAGAAGNDNITMRGGGMANLDIPGANDGSWHHVAVVKAGVNPGTVTAYVDGVQVAQNVTQSQTFGGGTNFRVGSYNATATPFAGEMDEFRLWSSSRTAGAINNFMNQEFSPTLFGPQPIEDSPVLFSEIAEDVPATLFEYIELTNVSGSAVAIGGWKIHYYNSAATTPTHTHTIGAFSLPAAGRRVIGEQGATSPAPDENMTYNFADFQNCGLVLTDANDNILDAVFFGTKDPSSITGPTAIGGQWWGPNVANPVSGNSRERRYSDDAN
ncbi:MAG: lamin tail domain-containing protein, partial [Nitrospira sp.]|nr:lamin tail domain-containing protein [Nitrospira sp.]